MPRHQADLSEELLDEPRQTRSGRDEPGAAGPLHGAQHLLSLQRLAGNKAVTDLIAVQRRPNGPRGTRRRPAGGGKPQTPEQREIRKKVIASQKRRDQEKQQARDDKHGWFGTETMLGKAWGWFSDSIGIGEGTVEGSESEEMEVEAPDVELTIAEGEVKDIAIAGGEGSGEGSVKASSEGVKGEGEISWETGSSSKVKKEASYVVLGTKLTAKGKLSAFEGTSLLAKGELTTEGGGIDLEAFSGVKVSAGGGITIAIGDKEAVKVKASVGYTIGTGGSLKITYSWAGGNLVLASSGDVSVGGGVTWDYSLTVGTGEIISWAWSSLPSMQELSDTYETVRKQGPITLM